MLNNQISHDEIYKKWNVCEMILEAIDRYRSREKMRGMLEAFSFFFLLSDFCPPQRVSE